MYDASETIDLFKDISGVFASLEETQKWRDLAIGASGADGAMRGLLSSITEEEARRASGMTSAFDFLREAQADQTASLGGLLKSFGEESALKSMGLTGLLDQHEMGQTREAAGILSFSDIVSETQNRALHGDDLAHRLGVSDFFTSPIRPSLDIFLGIDKAIDWQTKALIDETKASSIFDFDKSIDLIGDTTTESYRQILAANARELSDSLSQYSEQGRKVIAESSAKVLQLERNEIIQPGNDIVLASADRINDLINVIADNPKAMFKLKPREFEMLVARLFEKEGYDVHLTKQSRDGGYDILVSKKISIADVVTYVECKLYAEDFKVGEPIIRNLLGVLMARQGHHGLLFTTSSFTRNSRDLVQRVPNTIILRDGPDLVTLCNEHRQD